MSTTETYGQIVVLSRDTALGKRIIGGLSDAFLPATDRFGACRPGLLIIDAPDLDADMVQRALARAQAGNTGPPPPVILLNDLPDGSANRQDAFARGIADILPRLTPTTYMVTRAAAAMNAHSAHAQTTPADATTPTPPPVQVITLCGNNAVAFDEDDTWDLRHMQSAQMLFEATLTTAATVSAATTPKEQPDEETNAEQSVAGADAVVMSGVDAPALVTALGARISGPLPTLITISDSSEIRQAALAAGAADAFSPRVSAQEARLRITAHARAAQHRRNALATLQADQDLSYCDGLTGLRNRRFFDQRIKSLFERARLLQRPLSLLMFDIDGFKVINDRYGHVAGDVILREFATRLMANVRAMDLTTRYGGEEFVVAMPQARIDVALRAAERVRAAIAAPGFIVDNLITANVTVSVGVATLSPDDRRAEDLVMRADTALFDAKGRGKNRIAQAA